MIAAQILSYWVFISIFQRSVGIEGAVHNIRRAVNDGHSGSITNGGHDRADAAAAIGGGNDENVVGTFVGQGHIEIEARIGAAVIADSLSWSAVQRIADF